MNKDRTAGIEPGSAYIPHPSVKMEITGKSRAKQSFRDECDINVIMAQYKKTGLLLHVNKFEGNYGDLPSAMDLHTALNQAIDAKDAFKTLTAEIRSKFHNDPGEFLEFVHDPDNEDEMVKMGLANARPPATQAVGHVEPPPAEPTPSAEEPPPTAPLPAP